MWILEEISKVSVATDTLCAWGVLPLVLANAWVAVGLPLYECHSGCLKSVHLCPDTSTCIEICRFHFRNLFSLIFKCAVIIKP